MTETELILTLLGETATRQIANAKQAKGFESNKVAAKGGWKGCWQRERATRKEFGGATIVTSEYNLKKLVPSKDLMSFNPKIEKTISDLAKLPGGLGQRGRSLPKSPENAKEGEISGLCGFGKPLAAKRPSM